MKATGATTCGVIELEKVAGLSERLDKILQSMRFGHFFFHVRFERMDATEQFEEVVRLVPLLDRVSVDLLARHVQKVVLADLDEPDGLAEAISRLRPGWRPVWFYLPPSCFNEALAEMIADREARSPKESKS
jgi:hypothetical protein